MSPHRTCWPPYVLLVAAASFAVVVSRDGTVLATSYPGCYPVGGQGSDAQAGAPLPVGLRQTITLA